MSLRHEARAEPPVSAPSVDLDAKATHRRRIDRRWLVVRIGAVVALIAAGIFARISTGAVVPPAPVIETTVGGLACPSPGNCVAVGMTGSRDTLRTPYAAWFAGDAVTQSSPVPPTQNGDSFLSAVSCPSGAYCVAVGRQEVPAPYFGAKSAGDRPLVEVWTGSEWQLQRSTVPDGTAEAQLAGVDCASASSCVAVGTVAGRSGKDRVLTQFWDGSAWKVVVLPRSRSTEDPALYDVACTSPTACTAVGHRTYDLGEFLSLIAPLILQWNGDEWSFEPSANNGNLRETELGGIACPSPQRCIAVGSEREADGTKSPFAEVRDGASWYVLRTSDPKGTPDAELYDVACPSPQRCIAVGFYAKGPDARPLIQSWDGAGWTTVPAPSPPGASSSVLTTIACEAPDHCLAGGIYRSTSPTEHAYSARWDGSLWTIVPMPGGIGSA
ncbi:MAG: hypothetical protein QOG88_1168 [Actinomycetota bacterium]|nr:hypothetical protein [Actinomycetota bacterium]